MTSLGTLLLFAVLPPLSGPMRNATLAVACQTPIRSTETLEQLMPVLGGPLGPALPMDILKSVETQPRPVTTYDRVSVVASVTPGVFRPTLSWTTSAHGASILHELVHVAQRRLDAPRLRILVDDLRTHDDGLGFSPYVVRGATNSVLVSIRELLPPAQAHSFARHIETSFAELPAGGSGALKARYAVMQEALSGVEWRRARRALNSSTPSRFGWKSTFGGTRWSWENELQARLFLEAMAYDADARCLKGDGPRFPLAL